MGRLNKKVNQRFPLYRILPNSDKGLSEIVSIVLILALVIVMVGIVWGVVNNLVKDKLSQTGSCFEVFGKVTLNSRYTCYNSTTNELQFSISIGDANVDEALVGISSAGTSTSFKITKKGSQIANLVTYPSRNTNVSLPTKNAGLTYLFNMSAAGLGPAESIRIAPAVGKDQCEVSDTIEEIDNCLALAP